MKRHLLLACFHIISRCTSNIYYLIFNSLDIKSKNKMPLYRRKGKKRLVCERPVVEAEETLENYGF